MVTFMTTFFKYVNFGLGAIQKLRGQDFDHFWLSTYIFTLTVDKKKHFLTTYPPHLVHVGFEQPLSFEHDFIMYSITHLQRQFINSRDLTFRNTNDLLISHYYLSLPIYYHCHLSNTGNAYLIFLAHNPFS